MTLVSPYHKKSIKLFCFFSFLKITIFPHSFLLELQIFTDPEKLLHECSNKSSDKRTYEVPGDVWVSVAEDLEDRGRLLKYLPGLALTIDPPGLENISILTTELCTKIPGFKSSNSWTLKNSHEEKPPPMMYIVGETVEEIYSKTGQTFLLLP